MPNDTLPDAVVEVTARDFQLVHDILTRHTHSDFSAVEAAAAHRQAGVQQGLDMADRLRQAIRAAGVKRAPGLYEAVMAYDAELSAIRKPGGDDETD